MLRTRLLSAVRFSRPEWALIGITALWGGTFLAVHVAMQHSGPLFFVGVRFVAAGVISALVFHRSLRGMRRIDLGAGAAIGAMIFLGYGLQTYGLQTVSSSTSAFLTALYVPIVPLLQWVVLRRRPGVPTLVGVGLAFAGLLLIAGPQTGVGLGAGEIATLISTLPIAAEIILISAFAGRVDLGRVTVVQLLVAGVLSFACMPLAGEAVPAFSWVWLVAALALGASSCLIQLTMNWAQRSVSPTRATIIYSAEPVWGGVIGRLAGDRLPALALVGAALIVAGTLVSELRPRGARVAEGAGAGGGTTAAEGEDPPARDGVVSSGSTG
ncbi:DMT family transporter [Rathayibacter sp. VKM Ac-2856]|uniref:DMT family transporter n=1 Tax=unclassified Rathayibacter TaxID=2609250 RepID=UPI0015656295|nr:MULTISPECIES: DMT family transporter [unclassified Rathayibacter]NQX05059.1 DMT family transporter [Rathayibacter sp. VKM Ac-2858]NQX20227.1 DMT family transporter [Rathayibacter sp. VKM Ac-2856]